MKRRLFLFSVLVVALLVGGCGLWLWQAKRQYTLNRQLINALILNDTQQALALVNAGADPNTPYLTRPAPTLKLALTSLLHRSPGTAENSPAAFLLACGAVWWKSRDGEKMVQPCSENPQLVESMIRHGVDMWAQTSEKETALYCAVDAKHARVAQVLMKYGADVNRSDEYGYTPLMVASASYHDDLVSLLLKHGANVNAKSLNGTTALHDAIFWVAPKNIICLLLAHGANPNTSDKQGETPLMYAQQKELPVYVKLLRDAGQ